MTEFRELDIPGVFEVRPKKFGDDRGFFSETYNAAPMRAAGIDIAYVQDNHSFSANTGVLRGLHFQIPPVAQDKLVRVPKGSIFDVAVDIRKGSPAYGKWVGLTVSAKLWNQILVPIGFAHGFVTLEPDTEVIYKVSAPYSPEHERAIRYDDPDIGIAWPEGLPPPTLSPKDEVAGAFKGMETGFTI